MAEPLRIDFVSDVSCPWCAVGLASLQQALARVPEVEVELHFQPFELNPNLGPEGDDAIAHLTAKYGISAEQATVLYAASGAATPSGDPWPKSSRCRDQRRASL